MECYESRKDCRFMTCIIEINIRLHQQMNVHRTMMKNFAIIVLPRIDNSGDGGGGANSSK
jgi:hypothetical protein